LIPTGPTPIPTQTPSAVITIPDNPTLPDSSGAYGPLRRSSGRAGGSGGSAPPITAGLSGRSGGGPPRRSGGSSGGPAPTSPKSPKSGQYKNRSP
jgi:hypothetical protein